MIKKLKSFLTFFTSLLRSPEVEFQSTYVYSYMLDHCCDIVIILFISSFTGNNCQTLNVKPKHCSQLQTPFGNHESSCSLMLLTIWLKNNCFTTMSTLNNLMNHSFHPMQALLRSKHHFSQTVFEIKSTQLFGHCVWQS